MKLKNESESKTKNRALKKGTYSVGMIFVVLAIVVILNMIVRSLPATITKLDFSFNKLYTLTDTTIDYLKGLDKSVEIYLMAPAGQENESICNMLEKYDGWSSYVTFKVVDPNVNPNFVSQYTTEILETNSVIVVSGERSKIVKYSEFTTQMFDFDLLMYVSAFDGEGLITSAINYVVTDELPKMYVSTGHDEEYYTEDFAAMIKKANVVTEALNLLDVDEVPEDCDIFFIYSPYVDFTPEEADKLIDYLDKGGSLIFISGDTGIDFENLGLVLEYYGLQLQRGIIRDLNSKYYMSQNVVALRPARTAHAVTNSLITKGISVYMPNSQSIVIRDDARSSLTITEILTTSDDSYIRSSDSNVLEMQDGDIPGPLSVGTIVEETVVDGETKVAVYASGYMLNYTCNTIVSGANYETVLNTITWMADIEDNISISPKSATLTYLTVTQNDLYKWMIILVAAVPVAFAGAGFVVWFVRRRK